MFVASVREMENESKTITNPFISILIKLFQIKIKPFPSVQRIQHNNPPGTEGPKLLYTFIMPEMKERDWKIDELLKWKRHFWKIFAQSIVSHAKIMWIIYLFL